MILSLTPNLTLDRHLWLDRRLMPGELHRVPKLSVAAGGKGVNLARIVRAFGGEVTVAGVVAGHNGQRFRALLQDEGLDAVLETGEGETRECHIVHEPHGGHPTEIYESGPCVAPIIWRELFWKLPKAQAVAVCGSLPPGMTAAQFLELLMELQQRVKRPVVDSSGLGLDAAVAARVAMIKPNGHELRGLTGSASLDSAQDLYRRTGVAVLLTLGKEGAAYVGKETWVAQAPEVNAINPIGCGDSVLGAFLLAQQQGESLQDALRIGVAAGSANAMLGGPLHFDAAVARELTAQVVIHGVPG